MLAFVTPPPPLTRRWSPVAGRQIPGGGSSRPHRDWPPSQLAGPRRVGSGPGAAGPGEPRPIMNHDGRGSHVMMVLVGTVARHLSPGLPVAPRPATESIGQGLGPDAVTARRPARPAGPGAARARLYGVMIGPVVTSAMILRGVIGVSRVRGFTPPVTTPAGAPPDADSESARPERSARTPQLRLPGGLEPSALSSSRSPLAIIERY